MARPYQPFVAVPMHVTKWWSPVLLPSMHPPALPTLAHLHRAHRELEQLYLLLPGEDARAVGTRLVEVGLNRGPVVRHGAVHGRAPVKDEVAVHFVAVQVLRQSRWAGGANRWSTV